MHARNPVSGQSDMPISGGVRYMLRHTLTNHATRRGARDFGPDDFRTFGCNPLQLWTRLAGPLGLEVRQPLWPDPQLSVALA